MMQIDSWFLTPSQPWRLYHRARKMIQIDSWFLTPSQPWRLYHRARKMIQTQTCMEPNDPSAELCHEEHKARTHYYIRAASLPQRDNRSCLDQRSLWSGIPCSFRQEVTWVHGGWYRNSESVCLPVYDWSVSSSTVVTALSLVRLIASTRCGIFGKAHRQCSLQYPW